MTVQAQNTPLPGFQTPPPTPAPPPPAPRLGEPCTLAQLVAWLCRRGRTCPHALACCAQPVGCDARCLLHATPNHVP